MMLMSIYQGLYDLLQQGCLSSIESWALCKSCQVGLVADVLVDALSRSRVAVPLVAAFGMKRNILTSQLSLANLI